MAILPRKLGSLDWELDCRIVMFGSLDPQTILPIVRRHTLSQLISHHNPVRPIDLQIYQWSAMSGGRNAKPIISKFASFYVLQLQYYSNPSNRNSQLPQWRFWLLPEYPCRSLGSLYHWSTFYLGSCTWGRRALWASWILDPQHEWTASSSCQSSECRLLL